jgi:hypothetical protein
MTASTSIRRIALLLALAAVAAPVAQAGIRPQTQPDRQLQLNAYLVQHGTLAAGATETQQLRAIQRTAAALSPDLAGRTEAKGYRGITNYLTHRDTLSQAEVARLGAITEAKGFLGLARVQASAPVDVARLAAHTEATGYIGLTRYLVASAAPQPASVASETFAWGDAGIGAAVGGGVFLLLGIAAAVGVQRRHTLPGLS